VRERLDLLALVVAGLDAYASFVEVAIAVDAAGEEVFLDGEAEPVSYRAELVVGVADVLAGEADADLGEVLAVGLREVEDRYRLEAPDDTCRLVVACCVLGVGLVDHRGEDPDALLALAHEAVKVAPCVVAGDAGGVGSLRHDEQRVVEAVVVEAALNGEPVLPSFRAGELCDALGQAIEDVGLGGSGHGGPPLL
jgi:hypothetical protein